MPQPSSGATGLADPQEAWHDAQLPAPACYGGGARPPYARGVTPLRSVTAIVLGAALLALVVAAPQAQELLRISGSVQWIAGSRMQVMTTLESPIAVDLTQADQSSYQMLRGGDSVIVDGVLSSDEIGRASCRDV